MILSVHAIFGTAIASLVPSHPVLAFGLAFTSHLVLDAIPHREYELSSVEYNKDGSMKPLDLSIPGKKLKLLRDMCLVSSEAFVGIYLSFILFFDPVHPWIFVAGIAGSLLPDFLSFLSLIVRNKALRIFYNFHCNFIHSKVILKLSQIWGIFAQFCIIGVLIGIILGAESFLSL